MSIHYSVCRRKEREKQKRMERLHQEFRKYADFFFYGFFVGACVAAGVATVLAVLF